MDGFITIGGLVMVVVAGSVILLLTVILKISIVNDYDGEWLSFTSLGAVLVYIFFIGVVAVLSKLPPIQVLKWVALGVSLIPLIRYGVYKFQRRNFKSSLDCTLANLEEKLKKLSLRNSAGVLVLLYLVAWGLSYIGEVNIFPISF